MVDLPRSRALVAFDPNGFLLPIEPVTPAGSATWRFLHRAPVLVAIGLALFAVAVFASTLAGAALGLVGLGRRGLFAVPVIGTLTVLASYYLFVRIVERRRRLDEFELPVAPQESAVGLVGGIALFLLVVAVVCLAGGGAVTGMAPAGALLPAVVIGGSAAIVQEIIMRGELFRLIERLAGSWIALAVTSIGLGVIHVLMGGATMLTTLATVVDNGVLFAAPFMLTRRLWAGIGLHIGWNIAPALLMVDAWRSDDISGGAAGVPASWPGIVIAAAMAVVLLVVAARRHRVVAPAWTRTRVRPGRGRQPVEFG